MMAPPRHDGNDEAIVEQSESHPSSSYMAQSRTTTMAEGADLMREQDADILEAGMLDSTPVLAAADGVAIGSFDLIDGVHGNGSTSSSRSLRDSSSVAIINRPLSDGTASEANHYDREDSAAQTRDGYTDECAGGSSPRFHSPYHVDTIGLDRETSSSHGTRNLGPAYRRCLSGDDGSTIVEGSKSSTQESPLKEGSSLSVTFGVVPSRPASMSIDATEMYSEGREGTIFRSKSRERLIREATQFAEAVGEAPPMDESEVQEIIEESGSEFDDDDDDDAKEVRVSVATPLPPALSPHKSAGHRASSSSPVSNLSGTRQTMSLVEGERKKADQENSSRPRWAFKPSTTEKKLTFLHKLPDGVDSQDYKYKGICSNPPEITKRGISRGNYAQIHRKAWLEVSDKYHRYGKNLRTYYKHWETLGHPTNMFFDWLDSKGEAAGEPLPNLPDCPRSMLDSDTVLYIANEDVQSHYEIGIIPDEKGRALLVDIDGEAIQTGHEGWIFVLRDHKLYAAEKLTSINGYVKQRFHHSSFFGGKAVAAAGIIITNESGHLSRFYPHSGHYRPGEAHMQRMLFHLHHSGVDLRTFDVDTQQILHVARKEGAPKGGPMDAPGAGPEKKKKIHSLHLKPAVYIACFLGHKARFIGEGVYAQIHKIRKASVTSVTEALDAVDEGGYWKKLRTELVK